MDSRFRTCYKGQHYTLWAKGARLLFWDGGVTEARNTVFYRWVLRRDNGNCKGQREVKKTKVVNIVKNKTSKVVRE